MESMERGKIEVDLTVCPSLLFIPEKALKAKSEGDVK